MAVSITYLLSLAWGTLNGSTRYTKRKTCKSFPVLDHPEGHTTWAKTVLCCGGLRWLNLGLNLTSSSDSQELSHGGLWVTTIPRPPEVLEHLSLFFSGKPLQSTCSSRVYLTACRHVEAPSPCGTADLCLHLLDSRSRAFLRLLPFLISDNGDAPLTKGKQWKANNWAGAV